MRTTFYIAALSFSMLLISCGNKPKESHSNEILYSMQEESADGLQRMQSSRVEQDVVWNGKNYHIVINRVANDSLPKIKDEAGDVFVDNTITLSIKRNKGERFFDKTFTKKSFASVLDDKFVFHAMLEGMVYDKVTDQGMIFAASVSYPQSDLFVPVIITIAPNGTMTLRKELFLDENRVDSVE